jgi:hypothetical protein
MKKLGANGKQWLKSVHLTCSVIWLGAVVSMNLLRWLGHPTTSSDLASLDQASQLIDRVAVYPAGLAALLTGFLESWLTNWSFFKYRWVTIKWIVTVALILYGAIFQGLWIGEMVSISQAEGMAALHNHVYLADQFLNALSAIVMIAALALLPFISVLKPWMKKDNRKLRMQQKKVLSDSGISARADVTETA